MKTEIILFLEHNIHELHTILGELNAMRHRVLAIEESLIDTIDLLKKEKENAIS